MANNCASILTVSGPSRPAKTSATPPVPAPETVNSPPPRSSRHPRDRHVTSAGKS